MTLSLGNGRDNTFPNAFRQLLLSCYRSSARVEREVPISVESQSSRTERGLLGKAFATKDDTKKTGINEKDKQEQRKTRQAESGEKQQANTPLAEDLAIDIDIVKNREDNRADLPVSRSGRGTGKDTTDKTSDPEPWKPKDAEIKTAKEYYKSDKFKTKMKPYLTFMNKSPANRKKRSVDWDSEVGKNKHADYDDLNEREAEDDEDQEERLRDVWEPASEEGEKCMFSFQAWTRISAQLIQSSLLTSLPQG